MIINKISRLLRERFDTHPRRIKLLTYTLLLFLIKFISNWSFGVTFLGLLCFYLVTGGWRFARICALTWRRDLRGLIYLIMMSIKLRWLQRSGQNIVSLFQQTCRKYPDKVALQMVEGSSYTFKELDEGSNRIANCFASQGFKKGDIVAVFMLNSSEYVLTWLGLAKIGVVVALINHNLRKNAFAHCLNVSNASALVFDLQLLDVITESKEMLLNDVMFFINSTSTLPSKTATFPFQHLQQTMQQASSKPPIVPEKTLFNEKLLYIYTSGTTGMPKAAVVIHSRYFYMSNSVYYFYNMTPNDVIYDTLPLYHTAGGILGVGCCLIHGCTVVVRRKFSVSKFWKECIDYRCTVAQYIGEICRYLLSKEETSNDRAHQVRLMFGNGLRPQIWNKFKERFNIQQIGEFYGATEGNANIVNIDDTPGAIGFQTRIIPSFYPVTLIRVDPVTGEPIRNAYGKCVRCHPGEPGELVGKIVKNKPLRSFEGYANREANVKKIAYDVFKKGDCYFLTGDILIMDELGYMFFVDRTGDTFRWRGENVSTSEVESSISSVLSLVDCAVYGVDVPGTEGKAGMATIAADKIDLQQLHDKLKSLLPSYAVPVFIRLVKHISITGTFKLQKTQYRQEGIDPSKMNGDQLYYLDHTTSSYQPLTDIIYNQILQHTLWF